VPLVFWLPVLQYKSSHNLWLKNALGISSLVLLGNVHTADTLEHPEFHRYEDLYEILYLWYPENQRAPKH